MKDIFGTEARVGDIIISASIHGNLNMGKLHKIYESGHARMLTLEKRNVYAYEHGAPDVPQECMRYKVDENGDLIHEERTDSHGRVYRTFATEEYIRMVRDYTIVGSKYYLYNSQVADKFIVVSSGSKTAAEFNRRMEDATYGMVQED